MKHHGGKGERNNNNNNNIDIYLSNLFNDMETCYSSKGLTSAT